VRTLLDLRNEHGQTVAEYSVILAVITPAIVLVLSLLSGRVAGFFTAFASIIP
jgi:Flp pilus assembly pilin Flp